uniref:Cytochrome c-type biogenesis protein n=1 Tax=Candidatus Kentrum sp. FM TaxID=2126340 RepID=A0A450WZJ2_9GAMM|nr:MAG: cytochrome c-type biogenesis protein [Candidatus Kentron sp. FM]VFJ77441.1 MAG: cytochrome c-type biogenesis protein [Candidatus Kentron sp. FM]VFK22472.1 MAG: cytochrome c-type biogenesis protein [Candidatus Kentron sp. FM]
MTSFDVSLTGALIAGILSFVSPCVLPLVPAYLCYLGGASMEQLMDEEGADPALTRRVFIAALGFVAGFSSVFVTLGATATALGQLVSANMAILAKIAGVVIILFGLHFAGLFRLGFLQFEHRFRIERAPSGPIGAYVMGLAFGFGWTPCVGPVLATILMMAAGEDSVGGGIGLLGVYALGIGIPFLLAALAIRPFLALMARFRRHIRRVEVATGALLVIMGVLVFTGSLTQISTWLLANLPFLGEWG